MNSNAIIGLDEVVQGATDDTLTITAREQVELGDRFEGGDGTDTIIASYTPDALTTTIDFRNVTITGYEALTLGNTSGVNIVDFNASQLAAMSPTFGINGASGTQTINIYNADGFDASGFVFTNWSTNIDFMQFHGDEFANDLYGSLKADRLIGMDGDDNYFVNHTSEVVVEAADEGEDTVFSTVSHTLSANVENLILTGTQFAIGTGNALDNYMEGSAATNTLDGGAGADEMRGGGGNDTYIVDNIGDVVVEIADGGIDTVKANLSAIINDINVENLTLTGTAAINGGGNAGNNTLLGNDGVNILEGFDGNDILDGGKGADDMFGGDGDDTYTYENINDEAFELADEGTDLIKTYWTLSLGDNIENATAFGARLVDLTGNNLDNVLIGNSKTNILTGGIGNDTLNGGIGADNMVGGVGDDTYYISVAGDVITELTGEGNDTVFSAITHTLGTEFENLTLTGTSGLSGNGNNGDNTIRGNAGVNILRGYDGEDYIDGGNGADTMIGGAHNDTYVMDNQFDAVQETAGGGIDTVLAKASVTIAVNVENLTIIGSGALSGKGNDGANTITGNASTNNLYGYGGNDVIDGGGDNDNMYGGLGDDTYMINDTFDDTFEVVGEGFDTAIAIVNYTLQANMEQLILDGTSNINGTGSSGDNFLYGNDGNNVLNGAAGVDTIYGGFGADTLTGGTGVDTFLFTDTLESQTVAADTITDFTVDDIINLSIIDARTTQLGNQAFVIDTNGVFVAGEIAITSIDATHHVLNLHTNADGIADMTINVTGILPTTAGGDFIL